MLRILIGRLQGEKLTSEVPIRNTGREGSFAGEGEMTYMVRSCCQLRRF